MFLSWNGWVAKGRFTMYIRSKWWYDHPSDDTASDQGDVLFIFLSISIAASTCTYTSLFQAIFRQFTFLGLYESSHLHDRCGCVAFLAWNLKSKRFAYKQKWQIRSLGMDSLFSKEVSLVFWRGGNPLAEERERKSDTSKEARQSLARAWIWMLIYYTCWYLLSKVQHV